MSENTDNTATTENTETPKPKGQKRRTPEELRQAFSEMKSSIGAEGLSLQVDDKGRCTVVAVQGDAAEVVIPATAGNTFLNYLKGAEALAPFAS